MIFLDFFVDDEGDKSGQRFKPVTQHQASEIVELANSNQLFAFSLSPPNTGTIRETFFLSMLQPWHRMSASTNGDFNVDNEFVFEIGGRKKSYDQIKNMTNHYLAPDDIEKGVDRKIPLWMFGFLY